ncbi:MAG: tetratricopeptide repeat protein [Bacteroidia bacterium]|nr:tetratricopeptide repeat protein [Bacteroidia bacterium]
MKQKTTIKMKNNFKVYLLMAVAMCLGMSVSAQNYKIESVIMELQRPVDDTEKDLAGCIEDIETAASFSKTSNSPKMWFYKGLTYLKVANVKGDLAAAHPDAIETSLEAFQNVLKTDSKKKYTQETKGHLLNVAIGLYQNGYTAYQEKDFSTAYTAFEKALPLMVYDTEDFLKQNNLTADVLEQMMAFSALNDGNKTKAKKSFENLIDKGTIESSVYTNLANIHLQEGDTTKALEVIELGRSMNELDKGLITMELDIYLKQGRSKELIDKLDAAIELEPGNTIFYFARAISYEGLGNLEKAEEDYNTILEIDPDYFDAAYNKAVMYNNQARDIFEEMEAKDNYDAASLAQIDVLYKKAIKEFEYIFENNVDMAVADKVDLAKSMRRIYGSLEMDEKYAEINSFVKENE